MALQVTLGKGALLALGLGVGDIVSLYNLGRQFGNWLTAGEDDQNFLKLLGCDELDLLRRHGVLDLNAFNRKWSQEIALLANGRPQRTSDRRVREALENITRFTACMLTIVAVLDEFVRSSDLRPIIKAFLVALFSTHMEGELILSTELDTRINAWRSAACVRGLHLRARAIRADLMKQGRVQGGTMPISEWHEVATFLHWLLAGQTEDMTTSSSDVAGIAACLSSMVFDILWVRWDPTDFQTAACTLIYDTSAAVNPSPGMYAIGDLPNYALEGRKTWRPPSTRVLVAHPEEAMSTFPVAPEQANYLRQAWSSGAKCGALIEFVLRKPSAEDHRRGSDLTYSVLDRGSACGRIKDQIFTLVDLQAFAINSEICEALALLLQKETVANVEWLLDQYRPAPASVSQWNETGVARVIVKSRPAVQSETDLSTLDIQDPLLNDDHKVFLFTLVQAFFLGYYYSVIFKLVDTSLLLEPVVDGGFYYRSPTLLRRMKRFVKGDVPIRDRVPSETARISRHKIIEILPAFLFSEDIMMEGVSRRNKSWLGYTGKRTILASSLLRPPADPNALSKLVILDTDVSSIPRDKYGTIISGLQTSWHVSSFPEHLENARRSPNSSEDFTLHIEADWDVNVHETLICVRHHGRRIGTYHPLIAERLFLMAYVDPVPNPRPYDLGPTTSDVLTVKMGLKHGDPVLYLTKGRLGMRFAIVALYDITVCKVVSNCFLTALDELDALPRDEEELSGGQSIGFLVL